jgi:integrase
LSAQTDTQNRHEDHIVPGIEKLTLSKIARISKPGRYSDGGGLYLQVTKRLTKSWIFRYQRQGTEHYMGLGSLCWISLEEARKAASDARASLAQGCDPLQARDLDDEQRQITKTNCKTFDECLAACIARHKAAWRSNKHGKQWESSLRTHISPHLGKLHVDQITTAHVFEALEPIWASLTETACRLRGRIERILSWATTLGYRQGNNPARWRGCLQELLPDPEKLKKTRHHPAMPYQEIVAFYPELETRTETGAQALAFTILTACRSSESLQAKWEEIDFAHKLWTIPGARTKNGCAHRIPLTQATLRILDSLRGRDPIWVFPGTKPGHPPSEGVMLSMLDKMDRADVTVHGFRATFRTWVAEQTQYPREMAELALSHTVGSKVEQAYQRSDLFERRRALMRDWAAWCIAWPDAGERAGPPARSASA